jgi:hypothetical protein
MEFSLMPTKLDASAGDYEIELVLKDSFGEKTTYPFIVTVSDGPV